MLVLTELQRLAFYLQVRPLLQAIGDDPCLLHVPPDLAGELIEARESSLFPYALHKADVYDAPVEITLEIEEIGLDAALGPSECGGHPDVRTCGILFFAKADETSVDPLSRNHRVGIAARWRWESRSTCRACLRPLPRP